MSKRTEKKLEKVLAQVFSGMPCTNRETAAEKAVARKWMEKRRASLRPVAEKRRAYLHDPDPAATTSPRR